MEILFFFRYNVVEIVIYIRNKILIGIDGKNFFKNDFYLNSKVKCGCVCVWLMVFENKLNY